VDSPGPYSNSDHAEYEGVFCFDAVSITFVHMAGAHAQAFWATVTSSSSPYAIYTGPLSCLSVCNVGVLWPHRSIDQDATWYGGRPRPRRQCVGLGPSCPHAKGHSSPPHTFRLTLLWHGRPSQQLLSSCTTDDDGDDVNDMMTTLMASRHL